MQVLTNRFGESYLYEVNRNTFNQIGCEAVYSRHIDERLFLADTLHVIVGTDSGLLVRHLVNHGLPEGSRYVFVELPELLPPVEALLADLDLGERIHLVATDHWLNTLTTLPFSDYANINAVRLTESLATRDGFLINYRTALADVQQQLHALLWQHNLNLGGSLFIQRQLENLLEHHIPARCLKDSFKGRTAVLLAGGPSLDSLLPWIQEHQNDLVIFAVSRICRRLHEVGLTPHIVVSIDPTDLSFDISKELFTLDPGVVFVHSNHVAFNLLAQWPGRSAFLDKRYPWDNSGGDNNLTSFPPTVTNTALHLAIQMGFSDIILAGVDLCHSSEGHTHAQGSNERDAGPRLGTLGMRVETNDGRLADTTADFYNAISLMGAQAEDANRKGVRIINPSPTSARINGVRHVSLEDIATHGSDSDPTTLLHERLSGDSCLERRSHYEEMLKELAYKHGRLQKIIQLAEKALHCNDGLFGRSGMTADFKNKARMDKIERQLNTQYKDISPLVRMFDARAMLRMPPSDRDWTDEEVEQAGRNYYEAYRNNAKALLQLIEQAQQRVKAGIEEEQETPDYQILLDQWERDGIPGRAGVWRTRHPQQAAVLPPDVLARFAAMQQQFQESFADRDTGHARLSTERMCLTPVRSKLQMLFKERSVGELNNLVTQLDKIASDEAEELAWLGRGYLAELEDDLDAGWRWYDKVVSVAADRVQSDDANAISPRLEDALQRMSHIALSRTDSARALSVLEVLSSIAPVYAPHYAELLRLAGHIEQAVEVYTDYLQQAPDDLTSMLKLGRLFQSIGADDAAYAAYGYVLERDPDNRAASTLLAEITTSAT